MKSRKFNTTLNETTPETFRHMKNPIIYDRVLLFKNKYEQHLMQDFDILPMHFKQMKDLSNIELDKIAERLDFMMTEDEFFAGDVGKCTITSFVRNFNRFRSTEISKSKIDETMKAKELQKKLDEKYFICEKCKQRVKRTEKLNHEKYTCPTLLQRQP